MRLTDAIESLSDPFCSRIIATEICITGKGKGPCPSRTDQLMYNFKKVTIMNRNMLLKDVSIDSTTTFFANGDVRVYPCPWNEDVAPLTEGKRKSYRGRITVMEDGNTEVKRYHLGMNAPLYQKLFSTEHCDVLRSQGGTIMERWRFDKKLNIHQVWEIRRREQPSVNAFFLTLKEDNSWNR